MYYIIHNFEVVNGVVVTTPIGYTTNETEVNSLNSSANKYDKYYHWCETNATAITNGTVQKSDYFSTNPHFHGSFIKQSFVPAGLTDLGVNIWL